MRSRWSFAGAVSLAVAGACSSGAGAGAGAGDGGGQPCLAALDAGFVNGPESLSDNGQCGNVLTGTKKDGDPCQSDSECTPTCCTCPNGGKSAQVAWCNGGKCVTAQNTLCCAFVAAGASETDSGVPFVCLAH